MDMDVGVCSSPRSGPVGMPMRVTVACSAPHQTCTFTYLDGKDIEVGLAFGTQDSSAYRDVASGNIEMSED